MKTHIGEQIAKRLKEIGMTQAEFSRRIHTSRQNVSLIVKRPAINTDMLERICEVLQCNFFENFDQPSGEPIRERKEVFILAKVDVEDLLDRYYEKYGGR